jgi:hypothetical protein
MLLCWASIAVCSYRQAMLPMQASSIEQRGIERLYRTSAACRRVAPGLAGTRGRKSLTSKPPVRRKNQVEGVHREQVNACAEGAMQILYTYSGRDVAESRPGRCALINADEPFYTRAPVGDRGSLNALSPSCRSIWCCHTCPGPDCSTRRSNSVYFSRMFKSTYDVSPKEYRENHAS